MSHKGKTYPVEQLLRFYSGDAIWPDYPAQRYHLNWGLLNLVGSPTVLTGEGDAELVSWSPGDYVVKWRYDFAETIEGLTAMEYWIDVNTTPDYLWQAYGKLFSGTTEVTPDGGTGMGFLGCRSMASNYFWPDVNFLRAGPFTYASYGASAILW